MKRTIVGAAVALALAALPGAAGAGPAAPSMLGTWQGFGADGSLTLDVTSQQGRRFAGEVAGIGEAPMTADGTVSHETGASEGVNRVIVDIRPPLGPPTVFQGEQDRLSGLDLLVGRTVRTGATSPLAALHLGPGAEALTGQWQGEVELRLPGHIEPTCSPIVATFGGRTATAVSLSLGDDALGGLHAAALGDGSVRGFALVAQGVVDGTSNTILVLDGVRLEDLSIEGTATLLPGDGSKLLKGTFEIELVNP